MYTGVCVYFSFSSLYISVLLSYILYSFDLCLLFVANDNHSTAVYIHAHRIYKLYSCMPHSSAVCRKQCAENCVSFSTHPRPARTASLGVGVGQNRTRKRRWRWNRVNDSTHFRHALRMTQQRFRSVTRMMYFFFFFIYI